MKTVIAIAICLMLTGCVHVKYDGKTVEYTNVLRSMEKIKATVGIASIQVEGSKTDAEALGTIVGAAVKAAK
jgi:hypothetical protein